MNPNPALLVAVLAPLTSVAATAQNVTSPPGYLATEGAGAVLDLAGPYNNMYTHLVHVDQGFVAQGARSLRGVHLRRDAGLASNPAYTARSLPVQIQMAHADFSRIVNGEGIEDTNLRLSPWQTVFADRVVSMPSFVTQPPSGPAPWSLSMLLDTPFAYQATGALAIYLRVGFDSNATPSQYPFDGTNEPSSVDESGWLIGTGCQVSGRSDRVVLESSLINYGDRLSHSFFGCRLYRGVGNAPWGLLVGLSDPNLPIGACTALRSSLELVLPAGVTDASGYSNVGWSFPHQPNMIGTNLWLQAVQADPAQAGLPVALSNGRRQLYPVNPILPPHALSMSWSSSSSFGTGHSFYKGETLIFGLSF